jgi:hypothetical protein
MKVKAKMIWSTKAARRNSGDYCWLLPFGVRNGGGPIGYLMEFPSAMPLAITATSWNSHEDEYKVKKYLWSLARLLKYYTTTVKFKGCVTRFTRSILVSIHRGRCEDRSRFTDNEKCI